eukprot:TRINITY_DN30546_c0_g3_i1.p1 TRINITY_DN30546_c0_g3~~TRINITY_DN30546_c0_g3_i1.p1  ORF type:complete len:274 (+),score=25.64 TRINITY_DN30546_c0_g3_i1:92-823(+)
MKLIATGLVFRVFMKRTLTVVQWIAICMLATGVAVTKVGASRDDQKVDPDLLAGFFTVLCISICSACAGVYNEWLVKAANVPLQAANAHLYAYGCVATLVGVALEGHHDSVGTLLNGFNTAAVCLVISNALQGQVVSLILKYTDNIVKVFATSLALFVTAALSWILFGTPFDTRMMLGLIVVTASIFLYFLPLRTLGSSDAALFSAMWEPESCKHRGPEAEMVGLKEDADVDDGELGTGKSTK